MAITLPIGIRLAAGLLGTTIDRIGKLPQELPTLGVSLAGQAVRTSFRIRQEIAELATRGDELLAGLTGGPQEKPAWATFDEDEEDEEPSDGPVPGKPAAGPAATAASTGRATAGTRTTPGSRTTPGTGAARATPETPRTPDTPVAVPVPSNRIRSSATRAARGAAGKTSPGPVPATVGGDHLLTVAELKQELQNLDADAVRELLRLEETGPNRAAYLTLLGNRLTTLAHENGQSEHR